MGNTDQLIEKLGNKTNNVISGECWDICPEQKVCIKYGCGNQSQIAPCFQYDTYNAVCRNINHNILANNYIFNVIFNEAAHDWKSVTTFDCRQARICVYFDNKQNLILIVPENAYLPVTISEGVEPVYYENDKFINEVMGRIYGRFNCRVGLNVFTYKSTDIRGGMTSHYGSIVIKQLPKQCSTTFETFMERFSDLIKIIGTEPFDIDAYNRAVASLPTVPFGVIDSISITRGKNTPDECKFAVTKDDNTKPLSTVTLDSMSQADKKPMGKQAQREFAIECGDASFIDHGAGHDLWGRLVEDDTSNLFTFPHVFMHDNKTTYVSDEKGAKINDPSTRGGHNVSFVFTDVTSYNNLCMCELLYQRLAKLMSYAHVCMDRDKSVRNTCLQLCYVPLEDKFVFGKDISCFEGKFIATYHNKHVLNDTGMRHFVDWWFRNMGDLQITFFLKQEGNRYIPTQFTFRKPGPITNVLHGISDMPMEQFMEFAMGEGFTEVTFSRR